MYLIISGREADRDWIHYIIQQIQYSYSYRIQYSTLVSYMQAVARRTYIHTRGIRGSYAGVGPRWTAAAALAAARCTASGLA